VLELDPPLYDCDALLAGKSVTPALLVAVLLDVACWVFPGFCAAGDGLGTGLAEVSGITEGALSSDAGAGDSLTSAFFPPPQAPSKSAMPPMSKTRIFIDPILPTLIVAFTVSILYRQMAELSG
jgi:hypothetical protein